LTSLLTTRPPFTPLVAEITFAHPAMLAGLAAVLVPIAIHLINRGWPRTVVFPTIRFLRAATASQSRIHKLRHLILMLLRCAFVALLALAFARPLWFASAGAAANADRDTVAIVLLDVSASMGYTDPFVSTMGQAVTRTAAIVDSLAPVRGDRANVILVGLSPRAMYARPTSNLSALKSQLERIRPTAECANANAAIASAASQFADFRPSRKEAHIVSDFQRANWAEADFASLPTDTKIILHRIGSDAPRPNAAITEIVVEPPQPVAGESCRVSVRLGNHSTAASQRDVILRSNDGREWKRSGLTLAPRMPASVSFDVGFNRPGIYELAAEIAPDALPIDDRRYASVRVSAKLPVALCTDADLREGVTSSYLLARALAPFPDPRGTIDLRIIRSPELSAATLTGIEVFFLDASSPLAADGAQAIYDFLKRGGGVAAFLGFGAAAGNVAALNDLAPKHDLLPFEIAAPGSPESATGGQGSAVKDRAARVVVDPVAIHPLLRPLGDGGLQSLQSVSVFRHFATQPRRKAGETIACLDTGDAALATTPVGVGTLVVCNLSPDPQWSDLAKHAVFPGLVQQFVSFLRPRHWAAPASYVGVPVTRRWVMSEALKDVEITDPGGEPIRAPIHREGSAAAVALPPATAPGFVRIRAGGKLVESVAINVDPQESDLAAADTQSMQTRVARFGRAASSSAEVENLNAERHGRPLWHWALGAGLIMLAAEMVCLAFWRR
jgi:hypothetical protein